MLGEIPAMETRPRTPPSSYAPNPRNHLLFGGGSPNLGVGLLNLIAGLKQMLKELIIWWTWIATEIRQSMEEWHSRHSISSRMEHNTRTCLRRRRTLKRSKSVKFFRRSARSDFWAKLDLAHLPSISFLAHSFLTGPVPAARGS